MVILEPDGTFAQPEAFTRSAAPVHAFDPIAELLADHVEAIKQAIHYSFDVHGLGTVAMQIEREVAAARYGPHHFAFAAEGSR